MMIAYAAVPKGTHMSDNLEQTGKPDDSRINIEQVHEVKYWASKFGPMVDDVKRQSSRQ
jgi:hypothetical protein